MLMQYVALQAIIILVTVTALFVSTHLGGELCLLLPFELSESAHLFEEVYFCFTVARNTPVLTMPVATHRFAAHQAAAVAVPRGRRNTGCRLMHRNMRCAASHARSSRHTQHQDSGHQQHVWLSRPWGRALAGAVSLGLLFQVWTGACIVVLLHLKIPYMSIFMYGFQE